MDYYLFFVMSQSNEVPACIDGNYFIFIGISIAKYTETSKYRILSVTKFCPLFEDVR